MNDSRSAQTLANGFGVLALLLGALLVAFAGFTIAILAQGVLVSENNAEVLANIKFIVFYGLLGWVGIGMFKAGTTLRTGAGAGVKETAVFGIGLPMLLFLVMCLFV